VRWRAETAVVRSILCSVMILAVGCASGPTNPKLLASDQAAVALKSMSDVPITPTRSILILGGYMDPGFAARAIEKAIRAGTSPETEIIAISFGDCISFAQCRQRVLHVVAQWKDREIDVIANSMGGLVARFSAMDSAQLESCGIHSNSIDPAIRIHTLFTICSPHQGALMAESGPSSEFSMDMRQKSKFIACLDRALEVAKYEMICYGRTGDSIVGMDRSAPVGFELRWVDTPALEFAHVGANKDPRILADILATIRGEQHGSVAPSASP